MKSPMFARVARSSIGGRGEMRGESLRGAGPGSLRRGDESRSAGRVEEAAMGGGPNELAPDHGRMASLMTGPLSCPLP
jgi:hypothetical protein